MKTLLLIVSTIACTGFISRAQHAPEQHFGSCLWETYDSDSEDYSNLYLEEAVTAEIDGFCVPQEMIYSQTDDDDWDLWVPHSKAYFFYSDNLYLDSLHTHDIYSDGDESTIYLRTLISYDENDLVILEERIMSNSSNNHPQQTFTTSYNSDLLVDSLIARSWDNVNQVLIYNYRISRVYNENDLLQIKFEEDFEGGNFVPERKEIYTYNAENLIDTIYVYDYDLEYDEFLDRILVHSYNSDGQLVAMDDYNWVVDSEEYDISWGYTYEYFEDGTLHYEYTYADPLFGSGDWGIVNRLAYEGYCGQVVINEKGDDHTLQIFPNPSQGSVTIRNNGKPASEFYITDNLGKQVYQLTNIAGSQVLNFNLTSGIYLVHFKDDNGKHVQKFIIE